PYLYLALLALGVGWYVIARRRDSGPVLAADAPQTPEPTV
ncbi:MAG: hypothetical protein QOG20_4388, partial [Pseudonocardiales bacterium]|nr:hypothetical protein [Pseudonocardiales bacterium]